MNISIGYSRHKLLFSLILLLQLVYGGPQGLVVYQERVSQERVSPEGVGQEGVSQERVSGQEPVSGQEWVIGQNRGGRQEWIAAGPPDTYPGNPSPPNEQPPPYNGNLSMQPPPTYPSKCHVCTLSVSSVSLYYWPQESTNTDCLATMPPQPSPTFPPDLNPIWPSAYALFFSVTVNNACSFTMSYPTSTASFHQDALSTIDMNGNAQSFNLADLPCPPPGVRLRPGELFRPWFAWNTELFFKQNAQPSQCKTIVGLRAWPDPPKAFPTVHGGIRAPTPGAPPRGRLRREPANAHVAPWLPGRTMAAT